MDDRDDWKAEIRRRAGGRLGMWSHVPLLGSWSLEDELVLVGEVRCACASALSLAVCVVVGEGERGIAGVMSWMVWSSGRVDMGALAPLGLLVVDIRVRLER